MDVNGNSDKKTRSQDSDEELPTSNGADHKRKLIGIDGYWYDITKFIPYHPGGAVIEKYAGKDASEIFHAFHKQSVLKHRNPCAKMDGVKAQVDEAGQAFTQLGKYFENEGYYVVDYYWYSRKFLVAFLLFGLCQYLVIYGQGSVAKYFGAVALAAFWQQCGFFMHDFEHNQFTHNRHIDSWLGTFFGTFCFGVSGSWWRDEHFIHHAATTCVDHETKFADPQMMQPTIWAQNKKLWPFYRSKLAQFCVKIQHFTFLPICVFAGRLAIMNASLRKERRPRELIALALHLVWTFRLLSNFATIREKIIFYAIAAIFQGVLHIQLLISHYAKSFHDMKDVASTIDWYRMQVESNIDIVTPWWLDWFHGGLNFHLVHHLYPRMPRHYYREATEHVKRVCKEHGLVYDHCGWFEAVVRTLQELKHSSVHFSLDPN